MAVSDHLLRDLAPIPSRAWKEIDDEARARLTPLLAARRVVDYSDGGGWGADSLSLGRTDDLPSPPDGVPGDQVRLRRRRVAPLAEVRVPFTVDRSAIEDIERGDPAADLADLERAARLAAEVENRAVFHGWGAAGITGIADSSPYPAVGLGTEPTAYAGIVARAADTLRCRGIEGPYTLVIGPEGYTRIVETTEHGGFLLVDHLARITGGRVVWAPGVRGAVLLSERGGDFVLRVGQDLSVGYVDHDADTVRLYLEETFTFRVLEPDAAVALSAAG
ncbi:family 1 encapsulin nanocompartment shell protein [Pseudonocardia lacus]|uniref:family 1 encapsulin nanocompartment shell protein n=1 Tax=Pseudonocardia lacus TaxID=2835865 RepID=UPI001BDC786B|nr:family 1 encapsulin nanocompartment shell protein [Pseudonocardia lacus]